MQMTKLRPTTHGKLRYHTPDGREFTRSFDAQYHVNHYMWYEARPTLRMRTLIGELYEGKLVKRVVSVRPPVIEYEDGEQASVNDLKYLTPTKAMIENLVRSF